MVTAIGDENICRICQRETLPFQFNVNDCNLRQCGRCDFVQVANRPSEEMLKQIYSANFFNENKYNDSFALQKENERRLKFLKRYLPPKAKILDVGCALGDFIEHSNNSYTMWGIDASEYAIHQAKEKIPDAGDRLNIGFIEELRFTSNSFDGVVLWDTIEHLWDPLDVLIKLFSCLVPGGYLLLSTPNVGSLAAKIMGKRWAFMTPPEHLSFLTKKTFQFLCEYKLDCQIVDWVSKGKWANIGFICYKIKRVFPQFPQWIIQFFQLELTKKWAFYVPTGDVQYVVLKKR